MEKPRVVPERVQQLLDVLAAMPKSRDGDVTSARARTELLRFAPLPVTTADITIPTPDGSLSARVYSPDDPIAVLVYFHGGGWVIGDLESHDDLCRRIALRTPVIVVAVDYRLAPEHHFPAAADDADAALRWVDTHREAIDGAGLPLAVGGDSAGGNLAAVSALTARDHGSPELAAQLLIYPVTDYEFESASMREFAKSGMLGRDDMAWYWAHYLGEDHHHGMHVRASPMRAESLASLPPAVVATVGIDPLHDQGVAYARRLAAAGVPTALIDDDTLFHGAANLAPILPEADDFVNEIISALVRALDR
ncbi:MAG: alpha/beta hydrolase [Acidimicrobiia bacterium]